MDKIVVHWYYRFQQMLKGYIIMKNNNKNIVKDLRELLNTYLTASYANDFIKVLDEDILNQNCNVEISEQERSQIEYELPKGTNYRLIVDKVVTYCAKLLSEDRYFNLMLDLSQLMFYAGELSYSLEIAELFKSMAYVVSVRP